MQTILDFSSIGKQSVLYYLITKERSINETIINILGKLTKNRSLYYKSEINCMNAISYYATSPKQYNVNVTKQDLEFPVLTPPPHPSHPPYGTKIRRDEHTTCTSACTDGLEANDNVRNILKIKGLKRNLTSRLVTSRDFQRVAERNCQPKRVIQHSIIRRERRIFVVAQNKVSLTNLCTKQYFHSYFSNKRCFFSFPLYLKSVIES